MYKNKTLRGLAISAIVALGFSGLAAAPASANYGQADKTFVSLAPTVGEEWTVFADGDFRLTANKAATLTVGTLKLLVEDVDRQVTSPTSSTVVTTSPSVWTSTSTSNNVVRKSSTDGTYVMAVSDSAAVTGQFTVSALANSAFSASAAIKVTAWNDANGNGAIDSTEYASPTYTITFIDGDLVTATATLNRPTIKDNSISAVVSTTPTLNHEQGASLGAAGTPTGFDVVFNRDGFATTTSFTSTPVWDEDSRNYTVYSELFSAAGWNVEKADDTSLNAGAASNSSVSIAVAGTAVFTTSNSHKVSVGDGFTFHTATLTSGVRATVSKIVSVTSFEAAIASTVTTSSKTVATLSAYASVYDSVTSGAYGATIRWAGVLGTKSEYSTQAVVAADVAIDVAGSASVQGLTAHKGEASAATVLVKTGTTTLDVVATVLDKDGAAVGAGRVVTVTNANRTVDVRVNGKTGSDVLLTDANGQVKVTVTSTAGASTALVDLTFNAEGAATSGVKIDWAAQAFTLKDMSVANDTFAASRSIVAGSSYELDLSISDQWFAAPAATDTYRVVVTGTGAVNAILPVVDGKVKVTIGDNGIATAYSTTVTLQKLGTSGTYASVTGGALVVDTAVRTGAVVLGADKTSLYASATTVALSSAVAAKELVEADLRKTVVAIPDYKNNAVVTGKVRNASTFVNVPGAVVTISGANSLLFNVDKVYKRGSITVVADANGDFAVKVFSTTAAKDVVVTVAAMGNTATTKLTFTGIGVGEGTKLDVTAPASVEPASTVQVKAKLTDAYGNAVEATAGRIKVSYTGPGIIFGTLPTSTDKDGELMFSALLGAADKGSITVVVSYDQNGDGDYVDAKDLNTTKTIAIATAPVVVPEVAAVIGSFNGRWAVRVENAKGAAVSVKVGGNWYKYTSLNENYLFSRKSAVGRSVAVAVYVNGTLENVATITIK
jgi:trimeric autotransporter adhesin